MIKNVSLTPAVFHLPEAVGKIGGEYPKNPVVPRGPELWPLMQKVRKKLLDAFNINKGYTPIIFLSSGTGGIAATMGCCVDKEGVLVISNGPYGERMANFSRMYGNQTFHYELEYGGRPELERIESLIHAHRPSSVGIVHGATGTCSLNPLDEIADLVKNKYGLRLFVDCISSCFVEEIALQKWDVDVLIGSSNKGLHSTPGLAFLLIKDDFIDDVRRFLPRTPYFNLIDALGKQEKGEFPFTIDVRTLYEMDAALDVFFENGGLQGRIELYQERNAYLRGEYKRLGLELFEKPGMPLQNIGTLLKLPKNIRYETLADELRNSKNHDESYFIYSAQSKLLNSHFRIFNMGEYSMKTYENFIEVFESILNKLG